VRAHEFRTPTARYTSATGPGKCIWQECGLCYFTPLGLKLDDVIRAKYGVVRRDATIGFVVHALNSLKEDGRAVVTVSNSVLFQGAATGEIRRTLIEDDLIEAVITLPGGLFSGTAIPVTMLVLNKKKAEERKNKILIIDASSLGERKRGATIISTVEIDQILNCYTEWKEDRKLSRVLDVFEVRENSYNLMPSSYVQMEDAETIIGNVLTGPTMRRAYRQFL
jgi:type I restriction enzyme M protein